MAAYADFEYYRELYKGNRVPENDFERLAMRASEYLDWLTNDGAEALQRNERHENNLRLATCAIAEVVLEEEESNQASSEAGNAVVSESNDGFSVTYARTAAQLDSRGTEMQIAFGRRKYEAAHRYLWRTGLLYRGL